MTDDDDDPSVAGILHIRSLTDDQIRNALTKGTNWHLIKSVIGENANPAWITSQVADEAFMRGLIEHDEYDKIMEEE